MFFTENPTLKGLRDEADADAGEKPSATRRRAPPARRGEPPGGLRARQPLRALHAGAQPLASLSATSTDQTAVELQKLNAELQQQILALEKQAAKVERQRVAFERQQKRRRERGGGETLEQYLPPRLLHGLLPDAFLDDYDFYQDLMDHNRLRGYPIKSAQQAAATDPALLSEDQRVKLKAEARRFRLYPQTAASYGHVIEVDLEAVEEEEPLRKQCLGTCIFAKITKKFAAATEKDLVLLSLLHAREGTQLNSLARARSRAPSRSPTCSRGRKASNLDEKKELFADLVEMPRLKLSLKTKHEVVAGGARTKEYRLYSIDHGSLYVPDAASEGGADPPVRKFVTCAPHARCCARPTTSTRSSCRMCSRSGR